jgi:hypothetical protein
MVTPIKRYHSFLAHPTVSRERANRTLQDRLVKELRLAGISDIAAGNAFLPVFVERFNERFALPAAKPENIGFNRKLLKHS